MIRELIATKKKEGLSQSTIRNIMAPVRGMFFSSRRRRRGASESSG
jgi:hypothetical protein